MMNRTIGFLLAATLAAGLSACGGESQQDEKQSPRATASASTDGPLPPAIFQHCRSCHSLRPGENGIGPTLHGIYGRAAATGKFAYSPALRQSGLTWDAATLDKWLQGPMRLVPGTRMVMGIPDPRERAAAIEYLKTVK